MKEYYSKDETLALIHHGIKGQKWGVRRFQNYDGTLKNAGKQRYANGSSSNEDQNVSKKTGRPTMTDLDRLNDRETYKQIKDKKYRDDVNTQYDDIRKKNSNNLAVSTALATLRTATSVYLKDPRLIALTTLTSAPIAVQATRQVIAKMKEKKVKDAIESSPIDKETGLHVKAGEFTKENDMAYVNPSYMSADSNNKNNCMLCTAAYDMRQRGFNVMANKANYGYTDAALLSWYPKANLSSMTYAMKSDGSHSKKSTKEYRQSIISELSKQPSGARGTLMVRWNNSRGGHSVVYERTDSGIIIRDCQSNKTYSDPDKFLKYTRSACYARLDNVDFDKKRIREAVA